MRPIPFIATLIFTLAVGGAAGGLIGSLTSEGDGAAQPEAAGPADVLAAIQSGDMERLREIQAAQFGAAGAGAGAAVPEDGGQTAAPPPSEATAPPGTGEAETLNGVLRSVSENAIVIAGADGVDTEVALAEGVTVLTFVPGAATDLEAGQEAVLFGLPGEGGVTAQFLLAAPAGSGVLDNFAAGAGRPGLGAGQGAGRQGAGQGAARQGAAGQGGFAANLLVGPITAIDGDTVTIETERGAVSAAIDPEATLLQVLTETPIAELPPGQPVVVTLAEDGSAESIVGAPNLQSLLGGLFGGGQGGRGFGG